jgi:6-phosphogluconolactonase
LRATKLLIPALGAILALGGAAGAAAGGSAGTVYTLTNSSAGNAVLAFSRSSSGGLTPLATYPTGGLGSGAGLGSQGAVTITDDGAFLLAVNAGSDDLSAFAIGAGGRLTWTDTIASGGDHPISVTTHDGLVYALNDGGAGGIAGFRIDGSGQLTTVAGSARPLSSAASGPAQVAFAPSGDTLVVSEKATNRITTFAVDGSGRAAAPTWIASAGATPFGFAFDQKGRAIVSEAAGGAPNASTVSSYGVGGGQATVLDGPVATTESAACWVAVTNSGRFAYSANTGSGTVSGFALAPDGSLTLLDGDGVTGVTGGAPADLATSRNSRFLYVRTGGVNDVVAFEIAADGGLTGLGSVDLPAGTVGIAAR